MKTLRYALSSILLATWGYAGVITHTDYVAGNVITAASQNTNENTIVNEFNGNIDNTNIKTGGIQNANIAAAVVTVDKFAASVSSTFTYINNVRNYKRPQLNFVDTSNIDISTNTDTANKSCVAFPDDFRCVTENAAITNKYRRYNVSATCNFISGTEDSGPYPTGVVNNSWNYLYAVKSQIDTTKFVVCSSTDTPRQEDNAALNSMFGTNGWVPLGLMRYGDNSGATGSILAFSQSGDLMLFDNTATTSSADPGTGIRLAETTGTSLTYTWSAGTGTIQIPAIAQTVIYAGAANGGSGSTAISNSAVTWLYAEGSGSSKFVARFQARALSGITITNPSSVAMDIFLSGFYDSSLDSYPSPF